MGLYTKALNYVIQATKTGLPIMANNLYEDFSDKQRKNLRNQINKAGIYIWPAGKHALIGCPQDLKTALSDTAVLLTKDETLWDDNVTIINAEDMVGGFYNRGPDKQPFMFGPNNYKDLIGKM